MSGSTTQPAPPTAKSETRNSVIATARDQYKEARHKQLSECSFHFQSKNMDEIELYLWKLRIHNLQI